MSDCRFGVSPVNYPDPDPERPYRLSYSGVHVMVMSCHAMSCHAMLCHVMAAMSWHDMSYPDVPCKAVHYHAISLSCHVTCMVLVSGSREKQNFTDDDVEDFIFSSAINQFGTIPLSRLTVQRKNLDVVSWHVMWSCYVMLCYVMQCCATPLNHGHDMSCDLHVCHASYPCHTMQ